MGTPELHRTSIMLAAVALTTDRSMYPVALSARAQATAGEQGTGKPALAEQTAWAKRLDEDDPVTEVRANFARRNMPAP
ncbi:hypothetical protein, partial [Cereibacter changlensis]|uniref:hypothetical protein n=1 Tax=Cereibacter changlensis TaxID=402884 RepID=UPI001C632147